MILRIDPDHKVTAHKDVEDSTLQAWYDEGCVILRVYEVVKRLPRGGHMDDEYEEVAEEWIGNPDPTDPKQIPVGWTRVEKGSAD